MIDISELETRLDGARLSKSRKGTDECESFCPNCGKRTFYVSLTSGNFICFACGVKGKSIVKFLKLSGDAFFNPNRQKEEIKAKFELPKEFRPIFNDGKAEMPIKLLEYLKNRGIKSSTLRAFEVGYCTSGKYKDRVVIPVATKHGSSFVARDYTGFSKLRYLNPPVSLRSFVLGLHQIRSEIPVVCEGPFDCLKLWQHGLSPLCLFGSDITSDQLSILSRNFSGKTLYLMLDPEEKTKARKIAGFLDQFCNVKICTIDAEDPGESTQQQAFDAIESSKPYKRFDLGDLF